MHLVTGNGQEESVVCINPVTIKGLRHPVACRKCWQCRSGRVASYVGRSLAEAETSQVTLAVTLTYGPDNPNAYFLVYSDFQKLLKRLRSSGAVVRYIVAGEYGSRKGRAHWHAMLFFKSGAPAVPFERRIDWSFWPHGFSYFQASDEAGYRYLMKYALKDIRQSEMSQHFALSKKPVLGFDYLHTLGRQYGRQGHLPNRPFFQLGAKRKEYWLAGRARDALLQGYASAFLSEHGRVPLYLPDWAQETVEKDPRRWSGYYDETEQGSRFSFRAASNPQVRAKVYAREQAFAFLDAGHHDPQSACGCASCREARPWKGSGTWRFHTPF